MFGESALGSTIEATRVGEGEDGVTEVADDVGDGRARLELHVDGVGQGDELALAFEIEGDDGVLDVADDGHRALIPVAGVHPALPPTESSETA